MIKPGITIAALVVAFLLASPAQGQSVDDGWRQSVFLYGMGVAVDGDATVGPLTVGVDVSISDLFDALDFGAMAAYRIENGLWSFGADVTYMELGWNRTTEQGRASASLSTDQLTVMATLGRRLSPEVELLLSLAYFDVSADLELRVLEQTRSAGRGADWVDPMVGLEYRVPLGGTKWAFSLRGDVGGFGLESDLTLHGWAKLVRQNSDAFSWYFGYRYLAYDYETGSGINYQRYDLQQHGPGLGIAMSF